MNNLHAFTVTAHTQKSRNWERAHIQTHTHTKRKKIKKANGINMSECCIKSMLIKYAFTISAYTHKNLETETVHMHACTHTKNRPPKKEEKKKKS